MTTVSETQRFCNECDEVTEHKHGLCVECDNAIHQEKIRWMRTKRKAFTIVVSVACLVFINWALAQKWSGDDMTRAALSSLATGIGIWYGTSKKSEDKAT